MIDLNREWTKEERAQAASMVGATFNQLSKEERFVETTVPLGLAVLIQCRLNAALSVIAGQVKELEEARELLVTSADYVFANAGVDAKFGLVASITRWLSLHTKLKKE